MKKLVLIGALVTAGFTGGFVLAQGDSTLAEARTAGLALEDVMNRLPDRTTKAAAARRMADWAALWARAAGMENKWADEIQSGGGDASVIACHANPGTEARLSRAHTTGA
jgi:hypothetical protein